VFEPSDTKSESPKWELPKLDFSKLNLHKQYEDWVIETPSSSSVSGHDSAIKHTDSKESTKER